MSKAVMHNSKREPTHGLVELFPYQGEWTEADYLNITASTNHLIELSDGRLEFLSMPSERHQRIVAFLFFRLYAFVLENKLGMVLMAPLKVKLRDGKIREPGIVFMREENADKRGEQVWQGADLVVEVVSPDDPKRDTEEKFQEYAQAGIPEYWLLDPRDKSFGIFVLPEGTGVYTEHTKLTKGEACSKLLDGLCVDVAELFKA